MTNRYEVRIENLVPTLTFWSMQEAMEYIETTHDAIWRDAETQNMVHEPVYTIIPHHKAEEATVE